MEKAQKNAIKIIATAIEKYPNDLIVFIKKQGYPVSNTATKDDLQTIVVSGIANNETFRNQFSEWAINSMGKYSNFVDEANFPSGIQYQFGSTLNTAFGGSSSINDNLGVSTASATLPTSEPKKSGFFSGVTLNSLLGSITSLANNYATIAESKATTAISQSVSQERDNIASSPTTTGTSPVVYVGIFVGVIAVIGAGYYFYNKAKK